MKVEQAKKMQDINKSLQLSARKKRETDKLEDRQIARQLNLAAITQQQMALEARRKKEAEFQE